MLTVETIGRIRREFFVQGKTIKEIARELRVSRNTVRKVVRSGRTDAEYARQIQPRPKLGRWTAELEAVLAAQWAGDCDGDAEPVKSCVPFSAPHVNCRPPDPQPGESGASGYTNDAPLNLIVVSLKRTAARPLPSLPAGAGSKAALIRRRRSAILNRDLK